MFWKSNKRIIDICEKYRLAVYQRRWKTRYSAKLAAKNKPTAKDKALEHFDEFYGDVFKEQWPSIRLALLSAKKYIAVVNNFSDSERVVTNLKNLGGINIKQILDYQATKIKSDGHVKDNRKDESLLAKVQQFSEKKFEEELACLYGQDKVDPSLLKRSDNENDRLIQPSSDLSAASLNEFVPATKLVGMENWVPESHQYNSYAETQGLPLKIIEQDSIEFPPHLQAYSFENGNVEQFPPPRRGTTGVSDYYLLDGGSLLPVLALDLKPGDNVLDMCAAPGGKGFLCLQTLFPRTVVLNDSSLSRLNKLEKCMYEFFYDFHEKKAKGEIVLSNLDGRFLNIDDTFNKILVDVPCTTDRHSVMEDDNNMFKSGRIKERLKIPELQSELLINALKTVKVGGTVVYSTCSLAPTQNDGVIALCLRKLSEETDNDYAVVDMKKALEPLSILYNFGNDLGLRCGHLVTPYLPANFGPTYFCKILRIS